MRVHILCIAVALLTTIGESSAAERGAADTADAVDAEKAKVLETAPSQNLRRKVTAMFERARSIEVRFTSMEGMDRGAYDQASIASGWRRAAVLRCQDRCASAAPRLQENLGAALRIESTCPPRFAAIILFMNEANKPIGTVFVHESRQCIVLDKIAYFIPHGAVADLMSELDSLKW